MPPEVKTIIIQPGTMINLSNHEDDDALIAQKPLAANIVGRVKDGPLAVVIPEIDAERTFFIHQPEKRSRLPTRLPTRLDLVG